MASNMKRPARHRFAPLHTSSNTASTTSDLMQLQGIIFDMDGTLSTKKGEPQNYMFGEMRSAVPIPPGEDILDHIHSLPEQEQREAFAKIQAIERQAMALQVPQPGLMELMEFLDLKGVKKAICTRNFDAPVKHFVGNHMPKHVRPFLPIIDRDFRPPKPSPAGILHIAQTWGVGSSDERSASPGERGLLPLIMVGDSVDDMAAGHAAGAFTVLLKSAGKEELEHDERTDLAIDRLDNLVELLEKGLGID